MASTNVLPDVSSLSPEVLAFAAEQGVMDYLPAMLATTKRIFPDSPLTVLVEGDPEIADDYHIVFEVAVSSTDVAELLAAHRNWTTELFQNCPSTHVCVFRLGMVGPHE